MPALLKRPFAGLHPTSAAVLLMLAGMLTFTANDVVGKVLTGSYPVGEIMLFRGVSALLMLLPFFLRAGWRTLVIVHKPGVMTLRALLTSVDSYTFYFAVAVLPLADVMTYFLAAPIYVALFAPVFLGEKVGWRRWTAIGFGFLGVIVALEPSRAMFSTAAIFSVVGSMAFGFELLTARSLKAEAGVAMIFWQTMSAVLFGIVSVPFAWTTPEPRHIIPLVALGLLATTAHVMVNWAFKLADAAAVAPLQYTQLFWAIVFGWLVFGDFPSYAKFVGAALIIASGLYIFFRERALKKEDKVLPAIPE